MYLHLIQDINNGCIAMQLLQTAIKICNKLQYSLVFLSIISILHYYYDTPLMSVFMFFRGS